MSKYRCVACKFRFEAAKKPERCPYCSREASVTEEETAEDLLKDVDSFLE